MPDLRENDGVVLRDDLPGIGLRRGAIGTIVHVFTRPRLAFEVEFCDRDGRTLAQVPLTPEQIEWPVTA